MFKFDIQHPPLILNIAKIGQGKTYNTVKILRNFIQRIGNKSKTDVYVFNPSGDKTYKELQDIY